MSTHNPLAALSAEFPFDKIAASPPLCGPVLRMMACPVGCGAAAAVVASERFVRAHGLERQAVEIAGQAMVTDVPASLGPEGRSFLALAGVEMAREAARKAFAAARTRPEEVDVAECHNCFSCNELFMVRRSARGRPYLG